MKFGAVAIGRNEGARLARCLESLSMAAALVYVDSGSTDGSVQLALDHSADVIELDMTIPFTAARARNAGFRRMREIAPDLLYVQFMDGDSELIDSWMERALSFMEMKCGSWRGVRAAARTSPRTINLQLVM
jgi:glycosyltransferase involved in cell wall biosynthesis